MPNIVVVLNTRVIIRCIICSNFDIGFEYCLVLDIFLLKPSFFELFFYDDVIFLFELLVFYFFFGVVTVV